MTSTLRRALHGRPLLVAGIPSSFTVTDKGTDWHLKCQHCAARFVMVKEAANDIGNKLFLINHADKHRKG
jgi:hypothetical protein